MTALHHHQVTSRVYDMTQKSVVTKRKGRKIPREYTRQLARVDTTGGTSYCDVCKQRFTATYVRPVYLNLKDGTVNVCLDCIHEFKLVPVR